MMSRRRTILTTLAAAAIVVSVLSVTRQAFLDQSLLRAVRNKDTRAALDAVAVGADPSVRDTTSTRVMSLKELIGRLFHMRSVTGVPVLSLAVESDESSVVRALISAGAQDHGETLPTNSSGVQGSSCTLVMYAAANGNETIIRALAEGGSDVNARDKVGQTALFYASNEDAIDALLDAGVNINQPAGYGDTALDCSIRSRNVIVRRALIARGAMDNNAIHRAVYFQDIDGLKQMLDAGWNIDQLDDYQMTPLMLSLQSAERLSPEAAMLLIHRGANVNVSDKDGRTPLMCAAVGGRYPEMADESPKVLRALISKGAYVNVRDTRGNSALMTACWALRPELVLILLEHGAKVNVRSKDGSTALTAALTSPYTRTRGDDLRRVLRLLRYAGATK